MDTEKLAEVLFGDEPIELESKKEEFQVTDYKSADWCLVQAGKAADALAKVEALYREYKAKLDAWREKAVKEAEDTVTKMELFLKPFATKELAGKKKRSFELMNGKMGFRKLPDKVEFDDEEAVVAWAKENLPDAVKVKESVDKRIFLKYVKDGGELPEGSMFWEGGDRFYIDVR